MASRVGPLNPDELRLATAYQVEPMVRAPGCKRCGQTGYRGRLPIMEVFTTSPELEELINRGASPAELFRVVSAAGMRPMREVALERVRAGATTLHEVERVLGELLDERPAALPARQHILVVDDDAVSRSLARSLLEKNGFRVTEAGDGAMALEQLAGGDGFALVVLDLEMPRLGGREVLERLRAEPETARLPVVVLTGAEAGETEIELMDRGADDYIRKPIDALRFVARIKAALRRAGG